MRRGRIATSMLGLGVLALGGCTTVTPAAVKEKRSSGVTRRFDRPVPEVYQASVAAMGTIRANHPSFSGLEVVEQDAASGTVIAEQRLDSAILPGVGEKDAIGIFVAEATDDADESDVTVVALASDQIPGGPGTYVASLNGAEARVFPAIESALAAIPQRRAQAAAPSPSSPEVRDAGHAATPPPSVATEPATEAAPSRIVRSSAPPISPPEPEPAARSARVTTATPPTAAPQAVGSAGSVADRAYDVLRASGRWRPLVRETRADGTEEIRVGTWAKITESGSHLRLAFRDRGAPAADAAQLALELNAAGLTVDVVGETATSGGR